MAKATTQQRENAKQLNRAIRRRDFERRKAQQFEDLRRLNINYKPDDKQADEPATLPAALAATPAVTQRLWTQEDLAHFLNVPLSWVKSRSREGKIPHLKLGKYYRYDPISPEFKAWLYSPKQT